MGNVECLLFKYGFHKKLIQTVFSFMFWWLLSFSFIPKLYYILLSFPLVSHFFFLKEFSSECNLLFPFCFDAFSPFPLHLGSGLKILRQRKCEERKYKLNLIIIENNLGNQFLKKKKNAFKKLIKTFFSTLFKL